MPTNELPSFARPTASSQARRESTTQTTTSRTKTRQANTPQLSFHTPSVPFHPSTSRSPSSMSENYSRRSSTARTSTRPTNRASNYSSYPLSPASASISVRAPSIPMSTSTYPPSSRPTRSIRSPTSTKKKLQQPHPQPQPQPRYQLDKVELVRRLKVVESERFQEGLTVLNGVWEEGEAVREVKNGQRSGSCTGTGKGTGKGTGQGKEFSTPAPAPGPVSNLKASAAPVFLSKVEVICDSYSHSPKDSDSSDACFHTARSECTSTTTSFHTAPVWVDNETEAEAEAEKAFLDSGTICEPWQTEL